MPKSLSESSKKKIEDFKIFGLFVIKRFFDDDCTYRASALTFTTLLAVVPLMSVGFSILSTFPVFEELRAPLQDFIFENFVPSTGKVIQEYLQLFTQQVSKLSMFGVVFLFITALLVMRTIEGSMNHIFRVTMTRKGVSAFLLYWAILSLAPILLGLSLAASSYFFSFPFIQGYHAPAILRIISPAMLSLIGFTFLYMVVPNTKVSFKHGLIGAIVATFLFETAKKGFAYYLSQFNTYELLYGAFATIPIFFVWVYWTWLITLFGAEIAFALSVHYERRKGHTLDGFSHSLLWLNKLWDGQKTGQPVSIDELINSTQTAYAVDIDHVLSTLLEADLIQRTEDGRYSLSRALNQISLYELKTILPYSLPHPTELTQIEHPLWSRWQTLIQHLNTTLKSEMNISLENFFSSSSDRL